MILLVDSHDSFTANLTTLLQSLDLPVPIITIENDAYDTSSESSLSELETLLSAAHAIVIGPGPGNPSLPEDTGIIPYLLTRQDIPILGVCLGFQALCLAHGSSYDYLKAPVHGQVHEVEILDHNGLFQGFKDTVNCVRYHSIYIDVLNTDSLVPLAVYSPPHESKILMAVRHRSFPHYGVQYHPESICSSQGLQLVQNFMNLATQFNTKAKRTILPNPSFADPHFLHFDPLIPNLNYEKAQYFFQFTEVKINSDSISTQLDPLAICDMIKKDSVDTTNDDFVLLNSAAYPGTWSIIGVPILNKTDVISHSTELPDSVVTAKWGSLQSTAEVHETKSVWEFIASYMSDKLFSPEISDPVLSSCPFVGGLIGLISYEEGAHIQHNKLKPLTRATAVPDTKLCFIERFIVLEKEQKRAYVVSIIPDDKNWVNVMASKISGLTSPSASLSYTLTETDKSQIKIQKPNKADYENSFESCQEHLHKGNSYELCLTRHTKIFIPRRITPWHLYKSTVTKNPAPYSTYMNFGDLKLVSTSPERFISWDATMAQMRPIKGTVRKSPQMTLEKATKILKTPKELGENLMIVDLIRHDLSLFLTDLKVPQLMGVEEYKTVYQLVSVIEGQFPSSSNSSSASSKPSFTGIDLLRHALPPGSMTGAPKKRSVELLQDLEHQERRGAYSGVCGYWSLNNRGDWSVVIRSFFSYSDDILNDEANKNNEEEGYDVWRCGAGGAITVLSNCEDEWVEMCTKLDSVLQIFDK